MKKNSKNGEKQRSLINAACKKLGHKYRHPSDLVAIKLLAPYLNAEAMPKDRKGRRGALYEAAKVVLYEAKKEAPQKSPKRQEPRSNVRPKRTAPKRDSFYASWEWKRVRYEALRIHGHRCQCCGWMPGDTARGHLVVDHIKPRRKFPDLALEVSNLQILCNDCNMGKSNVFEDDFRDTASWLARIGQDG